MTPEIVIRDALNWLGVDGNQIVKHADRSLALAALNALVAQRDHAERKAALLDGGYERGVAEARVAEAEKEERRWYEAFHEHMVRADNAEARVAALTEALRKVKEFASDPFASEIVALRACLLEANEALGLPGPEDSPLRQMAREVLKSRSRPRHERAGSAPAAGSNPGGREAERGTPWKLLPPKRTTRPGSERP